MSWLKPYQALSKLPDLLLHNRVEFIFDAIPIRVENLSPSQKSNLLRLGLELVQGKKTLDALPPMLQIEPTNICNIQCPLCPTGASLMKMPKGSMSMDTFNKIMDELGNVLIAVLLYSWGEPFLHKRLPEMIRACSGRGIKTITSTNANYPLKDDEAMRIVESELYALIIAMDGSSQDIYQEYRRGGELDQVIRFTQTLVKAKSRSNSPWPIVNIRLVVNNRNQQDIQNVEQMARDLGANLFTYRSLGMMTEIEQYGVYETDQEHLRRFGYQGAERIRKPPFKCPYPFRQPTIFWDGTVVGCEYDYNLETPWGKIGQQPFREIWNSPPAIKLRHQIAGNDGRPKFCNLCPFRDYAKKSCILAYKHLS